MVNSQANSQPSESALPAADDAQRKEVFDYLIVLAKYKKVVLGLPLGAGLLAAIISLMIPNIYSATVKLLPPQQSQTNAVAILGQLGITGGLASSALGAKSPSDIFVAMLKSRTIGDALVERFNLKDAYDRKYITDARRKLTERSKIIAARDGVVTVEVEDEDPKRAAAMANGYIAELENLTLNLAIGEASQRRLFFERQLLQAKNELAKAEAGMRTFKEQSKLVAPEGQAQLTIAASANLRAQITAREVQLAAMRSFATEQNPEIARIQQELAGLRIQLGKMEGDAYQGKGDVLLSLGQAPEASLAYIQRLRDVKYQEMLFEILAKQFEIAKIDEAKNATLIQVLDRATLPERKSKPNRTFIVMTTVILAAAAAILIVLWHERRERVGSNRNYAHLISRLRDAWLPRKTTEKPRNANEDASGEKVGGS
jgi:tyrosine-protein kinase Etk/Wzc